MSDEIDGVCRPDVLVKGQAYWRDGDYGGKTYWASFCAECAEPFRVYRPNTEDKPRYLSRRCPKHAKKGVRV